MLLSFWSHLIPARFFHTYNYRHFIKHVEKCMKRPQPRNGFLILAASSLSGTNNVLSTLIRESDTKFHIRIKQHTKLQFFKFHIQDFDCLNVEKLFRNYW